MRARVIREQPRSRRAEHKVSLSVFLHSRALLLPAVVVMFAFFIEGSMDIWSVTYLRRTLDAAVFTGAVAFAAFSLAMAIGRLTVGRLLFGIGYRRTIQVAGIGSLVAGATAALTSNSLVAGIAFLFLGFFLATASPAAFGLVADTGADPALAIAGITTIGYSGFAIGPPIMGWLAETAGLRATMGTIAVATLGVVLCGFLRRGP